MQLFIAEKPSLARAIAQVLPLPYRRYHDYLQCGDSTVVAWCAGHILEPVMPEAYDAKFARWTLEDLPIVPEEWKLRVSVPGLLRTLKSLLPRATRVVNAGDPDREGQLLIDEVLDFLAYKGPVDRILIRDTSTQRRREVEGVELRWTVSNKATSIRAIEMGLGWAWAPEETVREELREGKLKELPLREGEERAAEVYMALSDPEFPDRDTVRLAEIIMAHTAKCTAHLPVTKGRTPPPSAARPRKKRPAP